MRQTTYLLLFILFPFTLFAQTISDDFEGNGNITTWAGDDCGMNNALANPFQEGINNSATVLEYSDVGGLYANIRFDRDGTFDLSDNHVFSLKIYVPSSGLTGNQPNQVSLKLQDNTLPEPWSTQTEVIKPIVLDQWQEVSFDFKNDPYINLNPGSPAPVFRNDFNRVLIQVNGENNNDLVTAYIDDFLYKFDSTNTSNPINYELVWADEFDSNSRESIDTEKWHHQTLLPNGSSWYNGEVQHYTNRMENSYMENGHLHIVAKREVFTDQGHTKNFTSARLNSKFAFTYGKVEVRAKLPFGVGTWPAIWMLGKNITEPGGYWTNTYGTTGWPACGEIDIMEHWGTNQNYVQSAIHTPSSFGATVNHGGLLANDVSNTFHVYGLEWTPEKMDFSLNGTVFYTYEPDPKDMDNWPFDADQYLLLNIAMQANTDPGFTESEMVIDYVRVYQEGTSSIASPENKPDIRFYPNPVDNELKIQIPDELRGAKLQVYSPLGQLVKTGQLNERLTTLNWTAYPNGIYQVIVESEKGRFAYQLVKN
jgi:beta-glucanase (GH16 family)